MTVFGRYLTVVTVTASLALTVGTEMNVENGENRVARTKKQAQNFFKFGLER